MKLNQFKNTEPKFYLEEYFAGKCTAWGVLETFGGSITKQFVVEISGKLDGKELILEEEFKCDLNHSPTVLKRYYLIKTLNK